MDDKKVSEDPSAAALDGSELILGVQAGINVTITPDQLSDFISEDATIPVSSLAAQPNNTIIGNNSGSSASPTALTATQTKTLLGIASGDVSGLASSATVDTTNASNISSGALPTGRLSAIPLSALAAQANNTLVGNFSGSSAAPVAFATTAYGKTLLELTAAPAASVSLIVPVMNEALVATAGVGKVTFRMPFAMTLTSVRASLSVAQATGAIFTMDINETGVSILSTKLTLDNTETTTATAATAAVISDAALADNAEISIDIDQIGDSTAKGPKIILIGTTP